MNDDFNTVYSTTVSGKTYYFKYANPDTHDGGKHFSGSAHVWENNPSEYFTVFVSVKSDEIDTYYFKIIDAIEKHIKE